MEIQTESVMKSATRSFVKSFMKILGFSAGLLLILFLFSNVYNKELLPQPSLPTLLPDGQGERKLLPMNTPALCVIRIDNEIGLGDLTTEKVNNILLDTRSGFFDNNRLKGILIFINTPGGTVVDSDNIYTALMEYKKEHNIPIYGFVDGLCASGGMYIAAACDKIIATPSSVIGSVGVRVGPAFNVAQAMEKYGVSSVTLTEGKDKDMLNPFRTWSPNESSNLQQMVAAMYERFINIVLKGRPRMTRQALIDEYGAHVFIAEQAMANGYIDEANGSYAMAISELAKAASIADGDAYQVIELSTPHTIVDQFSHAKFENMVRSMLGLPAVELQGKLLFML